MLGTHLKILTSQHRNFTKCLTQVLGISTAIYTTYRINLLVDLKIRLVNYETSYDYDSWQIQGTIGFIDILLIFYWVCFSFYCCIFDDKTRVKEGGL